MSVYSCSHQAYRARCSWPSEWTLGSWDYKCLPSMLQALGSMPTRIPLLPKRKNKKNKKLLSSTSKRKQRKCVWRAWYSTLVPKSFSSENYQSMLSLSSGNYQAMFTFVSQFQALHILAPRSRTQPAIPPSYHHTFHNKFEDSSWNTSFLYVHFTLLFINVRYKNIHGLLQFLCFFVNQQ